MGRFTITGSKRATVSNVTSAASAASKAVLTPADGNEKPFALTPVSANPLIRLLPFRVARVSRNNLKFTATKEGELASVVAVTVP